MPLKDRSLEIENFEYHAIQPYYIISWFLPQTINAQIVNMNLCHKFNVTTFNTEETFFTLNFT